MRHMKLSPVVLLALAGSASGQAFPAVFELSSLDGTTGFVLNGVDANDNSGFSVSSAGDVNGDGIDDLIIGAYQADPNGIASAGESYVVFGRATGFTASVELSSLDGTTGFVVNGIDASDFSGSSVSSAGDVNGDGIDDLIIGAYQADPNGIQSGESYVVFGRTTGFGASLDLSTLNGTTGFVLNGIDAYDISGLSVSSAGDVNGDGIDDLIISAYRGDPNGNLNAGESYVVFGRTTGFGASLELSTLNGTTGFVLNGIDTNDYSGVSVSSAGDVNGDGIDDLIIGAYKADPNGTDSGESYVVFGRTTGFGASLDLSTLNGTTGFVLNGINAIDYSGQSVSSAGDVNGDGIDDLIIGAYKADPNGNGAAGESYVVFGRTTGFGASLDLSTLNGTTGFVLNGIDASDLCGRSVSSAGDVNGDGVDDLIIGAFRADPNGNGAAGESYVVFGRTTGFGASLELSSLDGTTGFVLNGIDVLDLSGRSVSSAGDVNGDGIDDLIIGAYTADPNGNTDAGESYVVFGRATQIWTAPSGGNFDDAANWAGFVPAGGAVFIEPAFGGTITGPTTPLFLDSLTLGAGAGQTLLELQPSSLVSLSDAFTIPSDAALTGSGIFAADAGVTNDGQIQADDLVVITASGLINNSDMDISGLTTQSNSASMTVFGPLTNEVGSQILLRQGNVQLEADNGITNHGTLNISFADAAVLAQVSNEASGLISISGASNALINDNITNASTIVLTGDSSLVVLGSIMGNGVSGPGGAGTAGTVYVEGGIIPGGQLANPFGTANFDGDLNLGPNAHTIIEIGGTLPGVNMDQITAQNLGAAGVFEVVLVNSYVPQPGDVYQVLDFVTVTGSFSSVVLDAGLIAAGADATGLLVDGAITIPAECLADVNGDGNVSPADFTAWIAAFNAMAPECDQNGDSSCTPADFTAWIANFNAGCP